MNNEQIVGRRLVEWDQQCKYDSCLPSSQSHNHRGLIPSTIIETNGRDTRPTRLCHITRRILGVKMKQRMVVDLKEKATSLSLPDRADVTAAWARMYSFAPAVLEGTEACDNVSHCRRCSAVACATETAARSMRRRREMMACGKKSEVDVGRCNPIVGIGQA